jgi:hypothetical protein
MRWLVKCIVISDHRSGLPGHQADADLGDAGHDLEDGADRLPDLVLLDLHLRGF